MWAQTQSSCHLSMLFCKKVPACTAGPLRAETHCSEAESLLLARQDAENKEYKDRRQTSLLPDGENLVAEKERAREDRPEEKIWGRACLMKSGKTCVSNYVQMTHNISSRKYFIV